MSSTLLILTAVFVFSAHDSHGVLVNDLRRSNKSRLVAETFVHLLRSVCPWGPVVWVAAWRKCFPNRHQSARPLRSAPAPSWVTAFIVTTTFSRIVLSTVGLSGHYFCIYTVAVDSGVSNGVVSNGVRENQGGSFSRNMRDRPGLHL